MALAQPEINVDFDTPTHEVIGDIHDNKHLGSASGPNTPQKHTAYFVDDEHEIVVEVLEGNNLQSSGSDRPQNHTVDLLEDEHFPFTQSSRDDVTSNQDKSQKLTVDPFKDEHLMQGENDHGKKNDNHAKKVESIFIPIFASEKESESEHFKESSVDGVMFVPDEDSRSKGSYV